MREGTALQNPRNPGLVLLASPSSKQTASVRPTGFQPAATAQRRAAQYHGADRLASQQ